VMPGFLFAKEFRVVIILVTVSKNKNMPTRYTLHNRPVPVRKKKSKKRPLSQKVRDWAIEQGVKASILAVTFILGGVFVSVVIHTAPKLVSALGFKDDHATVTNGSVQGVGSNGQKPSFDVKGLIPNQDVSGKIHVAAVPRTASDPYFEFYIDDKFLSRADKAPFCLGGSRGNDCNSFDTAAYANGVHQFKVVMQDGQTIVQSYRFRIWNKNPESVADSLAPSVTIASPGDSTNVDGDLTLSVTGRDNKEVTLMEAYVDDTLIARETTALLTTKWDTSELSPGIHHLTVKAYDAAGNRGEQVIEITK
jgi:hypothetical protein